MQMTLEEYNKQFDELLEKYRLSNEYDDRDALIDAQYAYMENVLEQETNAQMQELLVNLIYHSTTGQVKMSFPDEGAAQDFDIEVWNKYGNMLLDSQIYEEKEWNEWVVDFMFGGMFCPAWDGLEE